MIKVFHKTLPNGFQIITVEMPHLHSLRVAMYINTGSRFETRETNGISHLLEHMMFRGTRTYPTIYALNNAIEEIGSDLTGNTRREDCSFWFDLHPKFLRRGLEIFSEIFLSPRFDKKDLEVEKKIVLAESLEDVDEKGVDTDIDNIICGVLWKGTPLAFKIIGEPKIIQGFAREDLLRHFQTYYVPSNMLLCVSGNADHLEVEEVMVRKFKNLKRHFVPPPIPAHGGQISPRAAFVRHDWNQVLIKFAYRAFSYKDPMLFPLTVLDDIVGAGISSRLNLSICEEMGLAYFVSSSLDCFSDDGSFDLDVVVKKGDAVEGVRAIQKQIEKLQKFGVSPQELKKSKERYLCDLEKDKDSPSRMCVRFGLWGLKGNSFTLEQEKLFIQQISVSHMKNLIDFLFKHKNLNVAMVGAISRREEKEVRKKIGLH